MLNSLDPDWAQHVVGPELGPNCLQRLSADDKSPKADKKLTMKSQFTCIIMLDHQDVDHISLSLHENIQVNISPNTLLLYWSLSVNICIIKEDILD